MTTHGRSENQTAISVSMTREMVAEIDARAKSLGLNRSQYLVLLARNDLVEGGEMVLKEKAAGSTGKTAAAPAGAHAVIKYGPLKRK